MRNNPFFLSEPKHIFESFWDRHPALFYGLSALLSFWTIIFQTFGTLVIIFLLSLSSSRSIGKLTRKFVLVWILNCTIIIYTSIVFQFPETISSGTPGKLMFIPEVLSKTESHFGSQWILKGIGKEFTPDSYNKTLLAGKNFSCSITIPQKNNVMRPPGNQAYLINGRLKEASNGSYYFLYNQKEDWQPIKKSWSLAEWRFNTQKRIREKIGTLIKDPYCAEFLSGITTGQFEDRVIRGEFGRLGLQHLIAISGFHFALLTSMLAAFLRLLLPNTFATIILIVLMTSYFVFLGASPSVLRAWIMCIIILLSCLLEKRSIALNSLGVAILICLIYCPLKTLTIGFQFSAAVSASILLFYPILKSYLGILIPKYSLSEMSRMSAFDQHCYCVLAAFREGLALGGAVNIIAIPLSLYYFQKFPILGIFFNLFIPFILSCCLFIFLIAIFSYIVSPIIGSFAFYIAEATTRFMLNLIANSPLSLGLTIRTTEIPIQLFSIYCCLLVLFGIWYTEKLKLKQQIQREFLI